MANTKRVLLDGPRHLSVLITGTAQDMSTAVQIVDRDGTSHSTTPAGSKATVPGKTLDALGLEEIYWSIDEYDDMQVQWNFNAGDEVALNLTIGEGYLSFLDNGILIPATARNGAQAADGDVQLISSDATAGDFTIKARFRKKWV